jgi:hypothetical protein
MGGVTNGWFVICVGDEVENRSMVAKLDRKGEKNNLMKRSPK